MSAIEFAGVEFTFSQLSGEAKVFEWAFMRDGQPMDVADVVFSGVVVDADERVVGDVVCEHVSDEVGVIRVRFPRLEVGTYEFEVRYQTESGDVGRVVFGRIGAVSSALLIDEVSGLEPDRQRLALNVPNEAGGQLLLEWKASSIGSAAAEMARDAAEKLAGVDATLAQLAGQVEEFRVFVSRFNGVVADVLVLNPATGTIWIGGRDTGQVYRGEPGKAPRVNAYGFWEVFEGGQWVTLPYRAVGRDGVDGASVRRVLAGSAEEVKAKPVEPGVLYYTPREGGGYDMWGVLEPVGWVCFGSDPYGAASEEMLGLARLATDAPVEAGAPVGMNKGKQLMVPMATLYTPGVGKVRSDMVPDSSQTASVLLNKDNMFCVFKATAALFGAVGLSSLRSNLSYSTGGLIGRNADGNIYVEPAKPGQYGVIKVGYLLETLPPEMYCMRLGGTDDETLAAAGVYGGAFQVRSASGWRGLMSWLDELMAENDKYFGAGEFAGVLTTDQFRQSIERGLELLPATTERLAGVYLSRGPEDNRAAAVLGMQRAIETFERKGVAYSKEEADTRFMSTAGGCVTVKVCKEGTLPPADEQEKGVLYIGL